MKRADPSARAGFTLLEVVLAMAILFVGVTAVLGLLSFGAALSRTAALRTASADAVEAIVADLEEGFFPLVEVDGFEVAGEPEPWSDRPVPGHAGLRYSATAVPEPTEDEQGPLEYRVEIEVRWSAAGANRSRTFQILLLREVPFGERMRRRFVEGNPRPEPR